jgi:hypothetical protein
MRGAAEGFQEHINAAVVAGRQCPSGDPLSRDAAPIPGGATRSGTPVRTQASATSGVERPPNSISIPARPSSFPVTFPDGTRRRRNVLNDGAPPAICGHPQIFAAPYSDSGRSLLSDLGSNTEASSPVSHASRTALRDGGLPPAQAGSRALRSRNPGPRSARGEAGLRRRR